MSRAVANTAKRKGGRVTPKGTTPAGRPRPAPSATPASSRYTPPVPRQQKVSPRWVPVLMWALILVGAVMIVLNYLELLPGAASNVYLLVGLAAILAGIITATQYR